jgi:hypothetical protein
MNDTLHKRIKSFAWRTGMMVLAVTIDFVLQNLASFSFSPQTTVVVGLILGEVSKYFNSRYPQVPNAPVY